MTKGGKAFFAASAALLSLWAGSQASLLIVKCLGSDMTWAEAFLPTIALACSDPAAFQACLFAVMAVSSKADREEESGNWIQ